MLREFACSFFILPCMNLKLDMTCLISLQALIFPEAVRTSSWRETVQKHAENAISIGAISFQLLALLADSAMILRVIAAFFHQFGALLTNLTLLPSIGFPSNLQPNIR